MNQIYNHCNFRDDNNIAGTIDTIASKVKREGGGGAVVGTGNAYNVTVELIFNP